MISSSTKTVSNRFIKINSLHLLYKQKNVKPSENKVGEHKLGEHKLNDNKLNEQEKIECNQEIIPSSKLKYWYVIDYLIQKRIMNISKLSEANHLCHIATFVDKKRKDHNLIVGINTNRKRFNNNKIAVHAEIDALQKLEKLNKKPKMDLIVLRVNKNGKLCESAPCRHCTIELSKNNIVNINNLYFSRSDGSITCIKFSDWLKKEDHHVSKGWKWLEEIREK